MGRPECPIDPDAGPLARFAHDLRALRRTAGSPPYRQLAAMAHFSATTLSKAAAGTELPTLQVTMAYVRACGGDPADWAQRWQNVATPPPVPAVPALVAAQSITAVPDMTASTRTARRWHAWTIAAVLAALALVGIGVLDLRSPTVSTAAIRSAPAATSHVPAALPAQNTVPHPRYDAYGCVDNDVPPSVRLDPKGDPRTAGWRSSQPIPWDGAPCANQIWWTPYLDGSAGRLIRFGWTFTTSIAGPTECMVSAYYPPPPSGHSGGTAHYTISGGGAPRPVTVVQADYKGTWHPLGTYRITSGRVDVTLDNTGADPTPWQGVIAGPIHVSCR